MKTIEKYIQFAIDNGYKFTYGKFERIISTGLIMMSNKEGKCYYGKNKTELIISKEFIEAIIEGIKGKEILGYKTKLYDSRIGINNYQGLLNKITTGQAIAIRENKLEEFINKLLP